MGRGRPPRPPGARSGPSLRPQNIQKKNLPFLPPPTAGPTSPVAGAQASRNGAVSWPVKSSISASSSTSVFVQPKPSASFLPPSERPKAREETTPPPPPPPSRFLEKIHGKIVSSSS
ncbi:hypothetical protein NL676_014838 [Syzygium grande]|nr:hypothetical protein NL676_014838 [Syzygium grande]